MPLLNKAVFLDRDNTINRNVPYCRRPEEFELLPQVPEAIYLLNEAGFKVVVITNQSGIGRGYFTREDLGRVHVKMRNELWKQGGASVDDIYFCPHHPDIGCRCRKPGTLLLERAAYNLELDVPGSFVVGDSLSDVQMGQSVGCVTALVGLWNASQDLKPYPGPDYVADDLYGAVRWILGRGGAQRKS